MLPALRSLHRWIGIACAIPIVLVSMSGGLLLFRDPYYRARYPSLTEPVTRPQEAGYAGVLRSLEAGFARTGVRVIKFPRDGFNAFHLYLGDGSEALAHHSTGITLARWRTSTSAPAFLFDLHAHLLAGATGEMVNGYLALVLVFSALSGLVLWIPRRRSAFRLRAAWPRSPTRPALFRSHAASGALLLAPVLVFSATGAMLVFYDQAWKGLSSLFDRVEPAVPTAVVKPRDDMFAPWGAILGAARAAFPEAGPAMYYPGTKSNAVLTFRTRLPGEWHPNGRSYVLIDPYTAATVQAIDARAQGAGTRAMHAVYPIHAARIGGVAMTAAALTAALGLTWLAVGSSWAFTGKLLARPVPSDRRTDDGGQGSRAHRRDLGSSLHTHEPG